MKYISRTFPNLSPTSHDQIPLWRPVNDCPLVLITATELQRHGQPQKHEKAEHWRCGKDPTVLERSSLWKALRSDTVLSECVLGELSAPEHTHEAQRHTFPELTRVPANSSWTLIVSKAKTWIENLSRKEQSSPFSSSCDPTRTKLAGEARPRDHYELCGNTNITDPIVKHMNSNQTSSESQEFTGLWFLQRLSDINTWIISPELLHQRLRNTSLISYVTLEH